MEEIAEAEVKEAEEARQKKQKEGSQGESQAERQNSLQMEQSMLIWSTMTLCSNRLLERRLLARCLVNGIFFSKKCQFHF